MFPSPFHAHCHNSPYIWSDPFQHCCCCCCWVTSVMSDSVWPHRQQPTRLPRPWDSPGKNTGVGCHYLLQCMKVKTESEVAQLCLTLSNPMDYSLPGSSVHGIFQARVLEWGAIAFSGVRHNLATKPPRPPSLPLYRRCDQLGNSTIFLIFLTLVPLLYCSLYMET